MKRTRLLIDPAVLGSPEEGLLVRLGPSNLQTLLAILAVYPSGACDPTPAALADRLGVSLYAVGSRLTDLAAVRDRDGLPLLVTEKVRGEDGQPTTRYRVVANHGIFLDEQRTATTSRAPRNVVAVSSATALVEAAKATLDPYSDRLRAVAEEWVHYLSEAKGHPGSLAASTTAKQYRTIAEIAAAYGEDATILALHDGIGKTDWRNGPDLRWVLAVAKNTSASKKPRQTSRAALPKFIQETEPYDEYDL